MNIDVDLGPFLKRVRGDLAQYVARKSQEIARRIERPVHSLVADAMRAQPHYAALQPGGTLAAAFGLEPGWNAAENVVEAVGNVLVIAPLPSNGDVLGGVEVAVFKEDFSDALSASRAAYSSRGGEVAWLEWLLRMGDKVVVSSHFQSRDGSYRASRSGRALMLPVGRSGREGFRTPTGYAGVETSNWITAAAETASPLVAELLERTARDVL